MSDLSAKSAGLHDAAEGKLRRRQIWYVFLIFVANLINYFDRSTISVGALKIRSDLAINATQIGVLLSVWSLTYALCNMPSGFLVDRFGPRKLAPPAIFIWSLAEAAGGLVRGFFPLLLTRLILGMAESPIPPCNAKVVSSWISPRKRALASACYVSASPLGPMLAPLLLTPLMLEFGWRWMFIFMGMVGMLIAAIYFITYREVEKAKITDEERSRIAGDEMTSPSRPITFPRWRSLFHFKTTWGLMLGSFATGWTFWIFAGWLPLYFETQFHFNPGKTSIYAAVPFLGGLLGTFAGGFFSEWLQRLGWSPFNSQKAPLIVGATGASLSNIVVALAPTANVAVIASFATIFFLMVIVVGQWAAPTVLFPKALVGSAVTTFNFMAFIGATLSPLATGISVDITGSFRATLLLGAAMSAFGAVITYLMIRTPVTEASISDILDEDAGPSRFDK
ncbi:MFS transporter [Paraburkholderia sp. Cy-641]|uniref:MFS transporter n=1 Tax=Paraburkholderia sp. Cy-641 TaxID=2608337 RepID=UPI00142234E2